MNRPDPGGRDRGLSDPEPSPVVALDEPGPCPAPIIALGRASRSLPPGTTVRLTADDPVVTTDVPAWCSMVGARIIGHSRVAGRFRYLIELPGQR